MSHDDLAQELKSVQNELKRAENDYSVCLLTGAGCRQEQAAYQRAQRRLKDIRKRIEKARREAYEA